MKKIICFVIVCLLLFQTLVLTFAAENGTTNESKWLTLSQNTSGPRYFVDSAGNPTHLFGMARCQSHADDEDLLYSSVGSVDALTKHYAELNCNFMRLAIDSEEICKEGGGVSAEEINRFITNEVDPDVQSIIRNGMYVMLDVHMYPPTAPEGVEGAQYTVQYAYDNYIPLLRELAKKYANEPMVAVIELWNEPYAADQKTLTYDKAIWNKLVRQFYIDAVSEIRKYDKRHVLLVSDYNAGWGTALPETWKGYYDKVDPKCNNTAFSIHVSAQQFDTDFEFYSKWFKETADKNNLCLLFGEIETEDNLMTQAGMENLINYFSETKDKFHFSGMLWRPHSDESNYVPTWKEWIKGYVTTSVQPVFRMSIEAENFADKSATADIVKVNELFGAPSVGTGIQMLPNLAPNNYYEASPLNNKIFPAGTYSLTVTSMGDPVNNGGFIVGYRTVSGKIYQIAELKGSNSPEIYNQTINFTSDEQIVSITFFSNENEVKSVGIDRVYLIGDSSYKTVNKSRVTVTDASVIFGLNGKEYDVSAELNPEKVNSGDKKASGGRSLTPIMIVMVSLAVVLVGIITANGIVGKKFD